MTSPQRGRPVKEDGSGDANTRMVRLKNDLADMIAWLVELEQSPDSATASQLCDPYLRGPITARYKQIEPEVEKIKQARATAASKRKKGGNP